MAVEKADYGGGGIWSMLAAKQAGESRENVARTQERIAGQQSRTQERIAGQQSRTQERIADRQAGLQRQGMEQQGQIARERIQSNERLAQSANKLSAEQAQKDRDLQMQLSSRQEQLQRDMAEANRNHQLAMAAKQYDQANELWEKQKNFYTESQNSQMATQAGLMLASMSHAAQNQKSWQNYALKVMKAQEDAKAQAQVFDRRVESKTDALLSGTSPAMELAPRKAYDLLAGDAGEHAQDWTIRFEALTNAIEGLKDKKSLSDEEEVQLRELLQWREWLVEEQEEYRIQSVNPHTVKPLLDAVGTALSESQGNSMEALQRVQNLVREIYAAQGIEIPGLPGAAAPAAQ
jgi:hypothetical protein